MTQEFNGALAHAALNGSVSLAASQAIGSCAVPLQDEIIAFQGFRLDLHRRQLRLATGQEVKLVGKPFDLLAFLVAKRDRLVSAQEICAHLWPNESKSEGILSVNLATTRKALAAHGADKLILTVPGKGYRFIGEVESAAVIAEARPEPIVPPPIVLAQPPRQTSRAFVTVGVLGLIVLSGAGWVWLRQPADPTPPLSLAVLPFRNLSDGQHSDYIAEAVTDDLTTALALIPGSVVTARGSAALLGKREASPDQIGKRLRVRYLVEGSVRADESGYHANGSLIEARTGQQVWSEHYDLDSTARGGTETAIVRDIASALKVAMPRIVVEHVRPDDPEAEKAFYQALSIMTLQASPESFGRAVDLLKRAVALAPDFSDALAELGTALVMKAQSAESPTRAGDLAQARDVIAKALAQSRDSTALAAEARLLEAYGDCANAVASAREALLLEPNSPTPLATLAKCEIGAGQLDQAAADLRTLLQVEPNPAKVQSRLALLSQVSLFQGHYDQAIAYGRQALAGDPQPRPGADTMGKAEYTRLLIMSATALSGDVALSRSLYTQYQAVWPNRSAWRIAAFSPKGVAAQPGFHDFIHGLELAGIPAYADPQDCLGDAPAADAGDFTRTPGELPPARTIDFDLAARLAQQPDVVMLDVGHGAAAPKGAIFVSTSASGPGADPAQRPPGAPPVGKSQPVVIIGDGPCGAGTVDVVRRMIDSGYQKLFWFRGGEEAWAKAGREHDDLRPQY